jgi:hypothetical protein
MASSFALGIRHSLSASSFPVLRHKAPQGWKRLEADHLKTKEVRAVAVSVDNAPKLSQVVKWQENKRIQTQILPIAADITTIRSLDWDRDRFDIEFGLQNGTTYNSFIINGEKLAVIETSHEKFRDLYLAAIQEEIDPNNIEYIIANHTEPDHSALIPDLLQLAPNATVVGSKVCIQFLQNLVLQPFKSKIVKVFSSIHQMPLSSVLHIGLRMKVI